MLSSARTADGSYDFGPLLAPLDPWVQGADLALCHLEVPVAPAGTPPSGYPLFGTPAAIASGLRAQGWDGCSTASNHSVDRGFAGVTATLDALDAAGLGHVGTARSAVEQSQPQLYTLDRAGRTVTVAHVAATYGTNGMPVDADKPWSVDRIDVPAMVAQATAARAAGADIVIASVHCCVEYRTEPSPEQVATDQQLADSGVFDLVIGHHAHVPQPVVHLSGGPRGEGMWVAYGLGNHLSNQDGACCDPNTDSGLLLSAQVRATGAFPAAGPRRRPRARDRRRVDTDHGRPARRAPRCTPWWTSRPAPARSAAVRSPTGWHAPPPRPDRRRRSAPHPRRRPGRAPVVVPRVSG